jgi:ribosome modulation factor
VICDICDGTGVDSDETFVTGDYLRCPACSGKGFADEETEAHSFAPSNELIGKKTEECHGGCVHTDEEHDAFDSGIEAGFAGCSQEDCPYKDPNVRVAWLAGFSVVYASYKMEEV